MDAWVACKFVFFLAYHAPFYNLVLFKSLIAGFCNFSKLQIDQPIFIITVFSPSIFQFQIFEVPSFFISFIFLTIKKEYKMLVLKTVFLSSPLLMSSICQYVTLFSENSYIYRVHTRKKNLAIMLSDYYTILSCVSIVFQIM